MSFKQHFFKHINEEHTNEEELMLLFAHNYTSGQHSFGDNPEVPAGDPLTKLQIEEVYRFTPELDSFLKKYAKSVTYLKLYWGSYHERSFDARAIVSLHVPEEMDDELQRIKEHHRDEKVYDWSLSHPNESITLPFKGLDAVKEQMDTFIYSRSDWKFNPKAGENREEYWSRLIEREKIKNFK